MRLSILLILIATLAPALAWADDDTVWLTDGGRVRGTVMEESPTTGVRVKQADGTVRSFKPGEVKKVDYATAAPASSAANTATPVPAAASIPAAAASVIPAGAAVTVHLEADKPNVTLQVVNATFIATGPGGTATGIDASTVCTVPCDIPVNANYEYRVGGLNVTPSSGFLLPREKGAVSLKVEAGDGPSHALGILGGSFAVSAAVVGVIFLGVGASADKSDWVVGGAVTAIAGTAVAIPLFILAANNSTSVKTSEGVEVAFKDSDVRLTARGVEF